MAVKSLECRLCEHPEPNCQLRLDGRFLGMGCRRCAQAVNAIGSSQRLYRLLALL